MAWKSIEEWKETCNKKIQEINSKLVNGELEVPKGTKIIIKNFIDDSSWLNEYSEKLKKYDDETKNNVICSFIDETWSNYKKIKNENDKIPDLTLDVIKKIKKKAIIVKIQKKLNK